MDGISMHSASNISSLEPLIDKHCAEAELGIPGTRIIRGLLQHYIDYIRVGDGMDPDKG